MNVTTILFLLLLVGLVVGQNRLTHYFTDPSCKDPPFYSFIIANSSCQPSPCSLVQTTQNIYATHLCVDSIDVPQGQAVSSYYYNYCKGLWGSLSYTLSNNCAPFIMGQIVWHGAYAKAGCYDNGVVFFNHYIDAECSHPFEQFNYTQGCNGNNLNYCT